MFGLRKLSPDATPKALKRQNLYPGLMLKARRRQSLHDSRRRQTLKPTMSVLDIVLSILLPPLAVFLRKGAGKDFVINLLLTIFLCGIGGIIHAFVILGRKQ
jgi:uncharacterized membrane protein YqaE (UPF0057 family)